MSGARVLLAGFAVALACLAGCAPQPAVETSAAGVGAPQPYVSGSSGELVTTLKVTKSPATYGRAVIYCVDMGDPPAGGEVLLATGDVEVTNDLDMNVSFQTQIKLSSSCAGTDGVEIVETNGDNCIPDVHHCAPSRTGVIEVAGGNTFQFVVFVGYARASYATSTSKLTVEQDYGRLSVLRWR